MMPLTDEELAEQKRKIGKAADDAMKHIEASAGTSFRFRIFESVETVPPFHAVFSSVDKDGEAVLAVLRETLPRYRGGADMAFKEAFNQVVQRAEERDFIVAEALEKTNILTIKVPAAIPVRRKPLSFRKA